MSSYHYFPDDILILILKKLPPKSLIKFLCVSKSFYSIITNPTFISSHLHDQNQNQKRHLFFLEGNNYFSICRHGDNLANRTYLVSPLNYPTVSRCNFITWTCNGVVCLYNSFNGLVCLYNPTIHKHIIIQIPKPSNFDSFEVGFGFDSKTNDYKVLAITNRYGNMCHAQLYSVRSNSWKNVEFPSLPGFRPYQFQAISVNGIIYWWIWGSDQNQNRSFVCLKFGLHEEVIRELQLPPAVCDPGNLSARFLAVIDSSIAILTRPGPTSNLLNVWRMEEDHGVDDSECWRILYRIKCDYSYASGEFCVNWDDRGVILTGFSELGLLIAFDEKNASPTNVVDGEDILLPGRAFTYTESLALLDVFLQPRMERGNHKLIKDQEVAGHDKS